LDAYETVVSKLDIREFSSKNVPSDVKMKVLDAARLTGTGMNVQHWRFLMIQGRDRLKKLADDSPTGKWVENADFAIMVLTDPKLGFHLLDAGRAMQSMQIAAWSFGVASGMFTGVNRETLERDFGIPKNLNPSVTVAFGYPTKKLSGKKKRRPLSEVAFLDRFGSALTNP
jgi:nitroreductase